MPISKPKNSGAIDHDRTDLKRSLSELTEALASCDYSVRVAAIRELSRSGDPTGVALLCTALGDEQEGAIRDVLAVELARLGGQAVVEGLLPMLRSDDAAVRNIAIDVLKELPQDVAPRMEKLLDDPDPDVRIFVVNVLEALRHPAVENWLIAVITMDGNANVVATALDLLIEVGTPLAVPALQQVATRFAHEPFILFSAQSALQRIVGSAS